jgi:hypothetical protein
MYGGHELRWSDNDKAKKWGGKVQKGAAAGNFTTSCRRTWRRWRLRRQARRQL